jgi:hypothetical protein
MYCVADSTIGCTEGEVSNGTGSNPWPYTYRSHKIEGTKMLMTCLPAMYSWAGFYHP